MSLCCRFVRAMMDSKMMKNVYIQTSRSNFAFNNIFNVGARIFNEETKNVVKIRKFKSNIKLIIMQQI